ncbi:hypothetical protein AF332_19895 [Sporosarcina globispora]|uniref:Uncharacterized protein n=1 Tax=Sporosarcina globispora TaxID=1459 RepID=A0A0M0GHC1_SPOGL|nr:hypothetical protein [Sporosarcina globispora]KON88841.1 hypothetical protein AF332_19895 [Sporosarcina globispora]
MYYNTHFNPYFNNVIAHRLVNPDQIVNLEGFYVDIELDNGQKICNAKLDYVSPEPDETQAIYGDVTYTIFSAGQPYTYQTNTRKITRISQSGVPGAVCSDGMRSCKF